MVIAPPPKEWPAYYDDTGCQVSGKCTECPLPQCKHDMPLGQFSKALASLRDRQILSWWEDRPGLKAAAVAEAWEISLAKAYRVRSRARTAQHVL